MSGPSASRLSRYKLNFLNFIAASTVVGLGLKIGKMSSELKQLQTDKTELQTAVSRLVETDSFSDRAEMAEQVLRKTSKADVDDKNRPANVVPMPGDDRDKATERTEIAALVRGSQSKSSSS
eukprot:ANDGO_02515.mRNA.1 hypothetical protein